MTTETAKPIQRMNANRQSRYRTAASGLLQALLFLAVFLPTGSAFGLPNVKLIALLLLSFVLFLHLFADHGGPSPAELVVLLLVISALALWSLVGLLNGQGNTSETLSQLKDISSTILLAWLTSFAVRKKITRAASVILAVVYGCLALSAFKLTVMLGGFRLGADVYGIVEKAFGETSFVPLTVGSVVLRMEFASDVLQPFALFVVLAPKVSGVRFGRPQTLIIPLVYLASGFFAFSRYIWASYIVVVLAAMIIQRSWKTLTLIVVVCLALYGVFREPLDAAFGVRFQSEGNEISDYGRVEQIRVLIGEFARRPVFGKGIGAHANALVRLETHSYTYEVQWLAFLMQFGVLGLAGILALIWASMRDLIVASHPAKPWVCGLFLLWLMSGFVNPHLTSSYAGAAFALFVALFYRIRYCNDEGIVHRERYAGV